MKLKSESEVAQSCPTLHDPTECSLPGSSVHGILQARVLEWGAIAFIAVDLHNTILYNYPHSCSKDRPGERMFSLHKRPTCLFQIFMLTAIIITISWFRKLFPLSFIFIIFNSNYWTFYDIKLEAKASRLACISSEIKWYFALPRTSQPHIHPRILSVTERGAWALTSASHILHCSNRANLDKRSLLVCSHHRTPNTTLNS